MLREIERKNGKAIWKSSDNRTGEVNFYGIRDAGVKDAPFEKQVQRLREAREAIGAISS